jgi:hypothetical protein
MATLTPEEKYRHELLLSRTVLRNEMRKALHATTPADKRALVKTWNEVYKPEIARELLRVAKNAEARYRIANWNLGDFDGQRHSKTVGTSSSVLDGNTQKLPRGRARRAK